ncbi:MAG: hypothetical protein RLZZ28_1926 [Bacteroidota bacterium]|jgi:hypothetical protein
MAINKNHEFEDLNGTKCAIVEKNASAGRVEFLKGILELNQYQVIVIESPPPKLAPAAAPATEAVPVQEAAAVPPASFTIGVTDLMFNATNAIFGRALKTATGRVVTLAYWKQQDKYSRDQVPYFEN